MSSAAAMTLAIVATLVATNPRPTPTAFLVPDAESQLGPGELHEMVAEQAAVSAEVDQIPPVVVHEPARMAADEHGSLSQTSDPDTNSLNTLADELAGVDHRAADPAEERSATLPRTASPFPRLVLAAAVAFGLAVGLQLARARP